MKFILSSSPVMPGEGEAYQYVPLGRSIIGVLTAEHKQLAKLSGELAPRREDGDLASDRRTYVEAVPVPSGTKVVVDRAK